MKNWIHKLLFFGKRKRDKPVELKCRNCTARMYGRFCHICGQDLFAGRKGGAGNIVYNFLDSMYSVDTKIFDTIRLLLFYPGKLTLEYYQGRIIRYVHPSKLFWFVSIVFFLYFSYRFDGFDEPVKITTDSANINASGEFGKKQLEKEKIALSSAEPVKVRDSTALRETGSLKAGKKTGQDKNQELTKEKFISTFWGHAPYASLVLVPFFSFLMFASFHRKVGKYSYHTMFALHFHAFVYLFIGITAFISDFWPSILSGYLMIVPFIYLMIAVYVFYKPRIIPAFLKMILVAIIYFFVMLVVLISFLLFVAYKTSSEDFQDFFG